MFVRKQICEKLPQQGTYSWSRCTRPFRMKHYIMSPFPGSTSPRPNKFTKPHVYLMIMNTSLVTSSVHIVCRIKRERLWQQGASVKETLNISLPPVPFSLPAALSERPFYEEWWFLLVMALVGLILILVLVFMLLLHGQNTKFKACGTGLCLVYGFVVWYSVVGKCITNLFCSSPVSTQTLCWLITMYSTFCDPEIFMYASLCMHTHDRL